MHAERTAAASRVYVQMLSKETYARKFKEA
jgi:hypothetical protein